MSVFCRNCKFWQPIEEQQALGLCRFNPPSTDIAKMSYEEKGHGAYWPITEDLDYCSKHVMWEHADQIQDADYVDPADADEELIR